MQRCRSINIPRRHAIVSEGRIYAFERLYISVKSCLVCRQTNPGVFGEFFRQLCAVDWFEGFPSARVEPSVENILFCSHSSFVCYSFTATLTEIVQAADCVPHPLKLAGTERRHASSDPIPRPGPAQLVRNLCTRITFCVPTTRMHVVGWLLFRHTPLVR